MENNPANLPIRVGVIDDHIAFTSAIAEILNNRKGIRATLEATSGEELLQLLKKATELPDILLMDIEMKGMDGIEATKRVTALYPSIKIIALTAAADFRSIILMIRAGACAYLFKATPLTQLEHALHEVHQKGKYHADIYNLNAGALRRFENREMQVFFANNEIRFLQLTSQGLTHREIAGVMGLTPSGIDYYRVTLFEKLNVNNRITMVLEALRKGLITLEKEEKL